MWPQVPQPERAGARVQPGIRLTSGPALKLQAPGQAWSLVKGVALVHQVYRPLMASEVTCCLKSFTVDVTDNIMGLDINELSFPLGGVFSTLLSILFGLVLLQLRWTFLPFLF